MGRSLVKCLLWGLIVLVHLHGYRGCFEEERMGLLEIKEEFVRSTPNETIINHLPPPRRVYILGILPSWVDDHKSECCEWERVTCNSTTGHVTHLSLHNIWEFHTSSEEEDDYFLYSFNFQDMVWFPNVSLFESLKELRSLDLSFNAIGGWIEHKGFESLLRLNKLESLDLCANIFNQSIIQSLRLLTSLKSLNLSDNALEGSLPAKELSVFEDLEILDLRKNRLYGPKTIQGSENLLRLNKLESIDLNANDFDWSIIQSLRLLTSLKSLNLSDNSLEGSLPTKDFAALDALELLDMSDNELTGNVPSSIGALSSLKSLVLQSNKLNGSLPTQGLCELKKLEELDLSWNNFEGTLPSCLYNLTSLQMLDLNGNYFRGNISSHLIAGLTSLKHIDLSYNLFDGFSFSSFANLSKLESIQFMCDEKKVNIETETSDWVPLFQLEFLVISNCNLNKLSNQIPTFLFHQHSLRVLDLSYSMLKGQFPGWLVGNNTRLEYVSLHDNSLSGNFHLPLCLNFTNWMDVSNNQLNGQLQGNIGNMLPNTLGLKLSNNTLSGSLPSSICNMSLLSIFSVSFNNFFGEVPKELLAGCSELTTMDLSNNNFDGHLLSSGFNLTMLRALVINDNSFSGTMLNEFSSQQILFPFFLDVSNNNMSGKIPTWICNQTGSYSLFFLGNNYFEGEILCETTRFQLLDISHNFLSGSLPSWSGNFLEHLNLKENKFSGSIPEAFFNVSQIVTLDIGDNKLSGIIPSAIGQLSHLKILLLRGNRLNGTIPTQLCQLTNIHLMDISRNFFSGTLPHCFQHIDSNETLSFSAFTREFVGIQTVTYRNERIQDSELSESQRKDIEVDFVTKYRLSCYKGSILNYMSGLDFSCNNLTGAIPLELGRLQGIHALNLSHNQFTGSIPKTFSNLTELESLDLSHNRLSGEIPPQFTGLTFLEVFSVAYNNLSGRTPEMTAQFSTFSASSYEGNPLLCGLPIEKNCTNRDNSPPTSTQSLDASDEKWYKVDQAVFFTSFSVTYIIFFLGIITVLYINPHWRQWCFNLVEDFVYFCYISTSITMRKLSVHLYN
ncbi:receptor-like protein 13 isoform X2 [Quercus suber]|uniref:receptor-like protein 13 isoform X2 n=1 Tax=Quercus suber TaxID=58331 RepID=UPI0032DE8624